MKKFVQIVSTVMMILMVGLSGCTKEGPAEKTGKKIDETIEKAGDKVQDTVKDAQE